MLTMQTAGASENVTSTGNQTSNIHALNTQKKRAKILLIDDDFDMASMLKSTLQEKSECKIDVAEDPFEAMNMLTENFYDLIILDWRLPVLNGGQTLKELEKELYFEPGLPIQWDSGKVPVVIFSSSEKNECSFVKTKHFSCIGFVSKKQPLKEIVQSFQAFVDRARGGGLYNIA